MKTFKKYVDIAKSLRNNNSIKLNFAELDGTEAGLVITLVKNDSLFKFFDSVKDIDVKKLYVICKYLDEKKKMESLLAELDNTKGSNRKK